MSRTQVAEKKEKSLAELLIIVAIIGVLMAIFIQFFWKQESRIVDTGFTSLGQRFSSGVNIVHGQWLMENKPLIVKLQNITANRIEMIDVNEFGWVDFANDENIIICQKIWELVMDIPLIFLKKPISAIEIKNKAMKKGRICRYSISTEQFFDYNSATGKISQK